MDTFFKAAVIIVVTVILSVSLPKSAKDFSVIMTLGACACLVFVVCNFLEPIVSVFRNLAEIGRLDSALLEILLKATGIGVLTEFVVLICNDSGNSAMGKGIQLLGSVVVLWLSLPLFTTLMDVVKDVLVST